MPVVTRPFLSNLPSLPPLPLRSSRLISSRGFLGPLLALESIDIETPFPGPRDIIHKRVIRFVVALRFRRRCLRTIVSLRGAERTEQAAREESARGTPSSTGTSERYTNCRFRFVCAQKAAHELLLRSPIFEHFPIPADHAMSIWTRTKADRWIRVLASFC